MRPWRSSYRCQHHRWRPPWKKMITENEGQIFSRVLDQNVKHLTAGPVAAENLVWVAWVNMFQTMMSDLFIGFEWCFPMFRRVVKERENAVKVVLHCELFLPVSSKRGVLWLLWSHILTRWSWELDTKSDKDDEEMKKEIPGHKKVQTTISPLDRCTPPGVRGEHTLNL